MSPASHDSLADYLHAIVAALPPSSPYCLVGALAVNAWGRLRATNDIDLLVLADVPARTELIDALRAHEFRIDETWLKHNPMAKDVVMRLNSADCPGDTCNYMGVRLAITRDRHLLGFTSWGQHLSTIRDPHGPSRIKGHASGTQSAMMRGSAHRTRHDCKLTTIFSFDILL